MAYGLIKNQADVLYARKHQKKSPRVEHLRDSLHPPLPRGVDDYYILRS